MYTYIHTPAHKYIPESLCHMPETLQTSYNHKNLKKKKKEEENQSFLLPSLELLALRE